MHPIGGRQVGWEEVRASWENVAKIFSNGQVNLSDQRICVGGDLAYELGTEHVHVRLAAKMRSGPAFGSPAFIVAKAANGG
jgi:ketosteroid isomerase-like protein